MIEIDCETTGLQPWSQKQYAFLWTFFDGENAAALTWSPDDDSNREAIQAWIDRGATEGLRAWNSKFDFAFAEAAGFTLPPPDKWHDGMVDAHAVNERRSVALKAVGAELFGEDAKDPQKEVKHWLTEERKRRKKAATADGTELVEPTYADVPMSIMEPYALDDVYLTRKIGDNYDPLIAQNPAIKRVVDFEQPVLGALYAVEREGLPAEETDYRALEIEVVENLEAMEDTLDELAAAGGVEDFNPRSSQQILQAIKGRGADMTYMERKDGKIVSADKENLAAVDDELARAVEEFRSEFKVLTTYVRPMVNRHWDKSLRMTKEPFIAPDGRIHANYRQVGARTGRMSCSDPNMQNQPRDDLRLRYCIRAEPGYKLVTCDLSNIEMVLFAAYAGEGRLLDAVRNGEDLHVLTARMLGLRDKRRSGGAIMSARDQGKTYNFSRVYGGGLRTIRRQFQCSTEQARVYKRRFDDAYPEVKRLTQRIEYNLRTQGYITDQLISGRRFRVDVRDAYKAANHLIQGTAAALLKEALVALHGDGVPVVALVHDEVIAHVPEAEADEARDLIIKRLTQNEKVNQYVSLRADGDIVDRWSQAKKPDFVPRFAGGEG